MPSLRHSLLRLVLFSSLLAGPPAVALGQQADSTVLARIDSLVSVEADAGLLSGIILLARSDRIVFQRAYGFANWELRAPNTPATRFGIGSITKVMTETLVDILAAEGRLVLDTAVAAYLGRFPRGPKGGVVTVRQLLTHRAGVPHRVTQPEEESQSLHPVDIVERVRAKGLLFEPGTKELYSSAGFTSLARVIEVVAEEPFDTVLRKRIFLPASMKSATGETGQSLMQDRAQPYRLGASDGKVVVASAPYKNLTFLTGAGSVFATAEDLLHFVRALHGGVFGKAGEERVAGTAGETWTRWYGRTDGYEASVDFNPVEDITLVFLSNLRSAANWQVRQLMRSVLAGHEATAIGRPPPVASPSEAPASFVGSYGDPADPLVISEVDAHLFRDESEFYPIAEGWYYLPASAATFRFRRAGTGKIDAIITRRGSQETTLLRIVRSRPTQPPKPRAEGREPRL